jgi:hypothetical protein
MRKLALMLVIFTILPAAIFAEWGVGPAVLYKSPTLLGQSLNLDAHNVDQFGFGGDLRFKLGWFQAEGLLLYEAGTVDSFATYLDAGVALDIAFLRLSLGVGPNFYDNYGASTPGQAGLNAKIGADVKFGAISVGVTYLMAMNIANGIDVNSGAGLLGAQLLFWL